MFEYFGEYDLEAIKNVSKTTKNRKDLKNHSLNSSIQITLRYRNEKEFQEDLKEFERYKNLYEPYGKYGLRGYKYDVGNFGFLDLEMSDYLT
ncbi:hypothetical protein [Oceanirhabdus sp. W0125-5]|uniref:hypothetical protein n=1 Tax=Oceanirhabdus sp. W0125-5 TaxID=2999116 RepID=UPI0022F31466|nr:hypothetical protein [Oceanirhabdus sp. W0125-5]WBW94945.1 hypothetical protein OW730_14705 [Oceanirhabdus sp. W0125-5]